MLGNRVWATFTFLYSQTKHKINADKIFFKSQNMSACIYMYQPSASSIFSNTSLKFCHDDSEIVEALENQE